ncbi:MAG: hypothetical protein R3B90_18540 [Planctomycetaceae bacterium]
MSSRFPFHRLDQVWLSSDLMPQSVVADRVPHSDHKLVTCRAVLLGNGDHAANDRR